MDYISFTVTCLIFESFDSCHRLYSGQLLEFEVKPVKKLKHIYASGINLECNQLNSILLISCTAIISLHHCFE